ncbi:hypothetical protein FRC06_003113 [Ceratobasidium sp. 370]|nr:hypothetical protein FRC06_003113 [Ceratobasidium sp. 370]
MKTCDIRCTLAKSRNFTQEEAVWLDRLLPRVQELTATKGQGAGKERERFYNEVEEEFLRTFIYRVPNRHADFQVTHEQQQCTWNERKLSLLRSWLRTKLLLRARKKRPEHAKSPVQPKEPKESKIVERDQENTDQSGDSSTSEQEMDELSQSLVDLGSCYMRRLKMIGEYKEAVRDVSDLVKENWAELLKDVATLVRVGDDGFVD